MASLQASRFMLTTSCSSCTRTRSAISIPKLPKFKVAVPQIPIKNRNFRVEEPSFRLDGFAEDLDLSLLEKQRQKKRWCDDQVLQRSRLMAVLEEVIDRVEMHKNIGEQRNNWNSLLLNSVNMITLTAALMAGIASMNAGGVDSVSAVSIASTVLLASATGLAALMNKIQPSQLVEEQRNATRLFKQLRNRIEMVLREKSEDGISEADVKEAIKRVLCLDKAYPLPLVGTMLEKFPQEFKPATWWPETKPESTHSRAEANGWNSELEMEMREVVEVIKSRDAEEYEKLGNVALKLNRVLAISGPVLTGIAAVSSSFIGHGSGLAGVVATTCASLAAVVNTLEHGGQVGMVFEMYRNSAGFFSLLEDTINTERRENGQVFETKVALKLGRSLSELRDLARRSSLSSWSKLPLDLLIMVFERLAFVDFQRTKSVCQAWLHASRQSAPNNQIPWLIMFPEKGKDYYIPRQIFETHVNYDEGIEKGMPERIYPELGDVWHVKRTHLVVTLTGETLRVKSMIWSHLDVWSFRIYKLNSSNTDWEKLTSLGDEAVLLDQGITVLASATEGINRNSIYFSGYHDPEYDDHVWSEKDIFVFNLDTQEVERPHQSICSSIQLSDARWFVPNFKHI
ncbi:unnamed protein product [Arabidopsis halleri]